MRRNIHYRTFVMQLVTRSAPIANLNLFFSGQGPHCSHAIEGEVRECNAESGSRRAPHSGCSFSAVRNNYGRANH